MSSCIGKNIRRNKQLLWKISQEIWKNPELCFEEKFAHDLLTSVLADSGFSVQRNYLLSTAFRAEYDSGKDGPTVVAVCEYDALPGIGHACGHNLIAEVGLGVGMAVKDAMEVDPTIGGKIVVMGTPAEEGGGGKIQLIQRGAFKDVDAVMMAHPQSVNRLYPLIVESAFLTVTFRSESIGDVWSDLNAVDAAVSCYNNFALMRRSLKEKWRVSIIIPTSGPEESKIEIIYRAPSHGEMNILREKLQFQIDIAAQATNCTYTTNGETTRSSYRGLIYNRTMTEVFGKYARSLGVKFYDKDPRHVESAVSSDIGNVSQIVPAMQPEFYIGAAPPHVNHTAGFADVTGSEAAQEYTLIVTEALAETAVDLLSNPDLMAAVKNEFDLNPLKDPGSCKRKTGE